MKNTPPPSKRTSISSLLLLLISGLLLMFTVYILIVPPVDTNNAKQYQHYRAKGDSLYQLKAYEDALTFYKTALTYKKQDRYIENQIKLAAQMLNITFIESFGGTKKDIGYTVVSTIDGGYVVGGSTQSYGKGGTDAWLLKTDSRGILDWRRTFGSSRNEQLNDCINDLNTYLICVGTFNNQQTVVTTNSKGRLQQQLAINQGKGKRIVLLNDTSFLVLGSAIVSDTTGSDISLSLLQFDTALKKYELVWTKYVPLADNEYPNDIAWHSNNTATIVGHVILNYNSLKDTADIDIAQNINTEEAMNAFVLNIDTSLNIYWQQTLGGNQNDWFNAVCIDKKEQIVVAGSSTSYHKNETDVWVMKFSNEGKKIWEKIIGVANKELIFTMATDDNNHYWLAGYTKNNTTKQQSAWLLQLNAEGRVRWQQKFAEDGQKAQAFDLLPQADGGCVATGSLNDNLLLLKTDKNGKINHK